MKGGRKMEVQEIETTLQELEKRELINLDQALGIIHELLPEIYKECAFSLLQAANTSELHRRELAEIAERTITD